MAFDWLCPKENRDTNKALKTNDFSEVMLFITTWFFK